MYLQDTKLADLVEAIAEAADRHQRQQTSKEAAADLAADPVLLRQVIVWGNDFQFSEQPYAFLVQVRASWIGTGPQHRPRLGNF